MNAPIHQPKPFADQTSKERRETISALSLAGLTQRGIADELGISRSSVAGYLNRARATGDLPPAKPVSVAANRKRGAPGGKPGRKLIEARRKAKVKPEPQPIITITEAAAWDPIPGVEPIPLTELEPGRCKWPCYEGDEPRLFCGAPADLGEPYCRSHAHLSLPTYRRKDA